MINSQHKRPKLRAIVDPGVLVSAMISRKAGTAPLLVVSSWLTSAFVPVMSIKLLEELSNVLHRTKFRRHFSEADAETFVNDLWRRAELHHDPVLPQVPITTDPKDDYLVALARSVNADVLVSGDQHLKVHEDADFKVLTPRAFIDELNLHNRG